MKKIARKFYTRLILKEAHTHTYQATSGQKPRAKSSFTRFQVRINSEKKASSEEEKQKKEKDFLFTNEDENETQGEQSASLRQVCLLL